MRLCACNASFAICSMSSSSCFCRSFFSRSFASIGCVRSSAERWGDPGRLTVRVRGVAARVGRRTSRPFWTSGRRKRRRNDEEDDADDVAERGDVTASENAIERARWARPAGRTLPSAAFLPLNIAAWRASSAHLLASACASARRVRVRGRRVQFKSTLATKKRTLRTRDARRSGAVEEGTPDPNGGGHVLVMIPQVGFHFFTKKLVHVITMINEGASFARSGDGTPPLLVRRNPLRIPGSPSAPGAGGATQNRRPRGVHRAREVHQVIHPRRRRNLKLFHRAGARASADAGARGRGSPSLTPVAALRAFKLFRLFKVLRLFRCSGR